MLIETTTSFDTQKMPKTASLALKNSQASALATFDYLPAQDRNSM
jgi:hypothetical protein